MSRFHAARQRMALGVAVLRRHHRPPREPGRAERQDVRGVGEAQDRVGPAGADRPPEHADPAEIPGQSLDPAARDGRHGERDVPDRGIQGIEGRMGAVVEREERHRATADAPRRWRASPRRARRRRGRGTTRPGSAAPALARQRAIVPGSDPRPTIRANSPRMAQKVSRLRASAYRCSTSARRDAVIRDRRSRSASAA